MPLRMVRPRLSVASAASGRPAASGPGPVRSAWFGASPSDDAGRLCARSGLVGLGLAVLLSFAGCTTESVLDPGLPAGSAMVPTGFGANDLAARMSNRGGAFGATSAASARHRAELYGGAEPGEGGARPVSRGGGPAAGIVSDKDGYQLNFESAEIADVCRAVLGDVLQANYTIDPRVSGQITLSSARPVPKASLVRLLETALKGVNATVAREGDLFRVIPSPDSIGSGATELARASEGFGVTAIPVRHVSVQTLARMMENFVTRAGAIRPDPASGLILVMGSATERQAALDAASVIDTDLMRSQSVGLFPLANSSPGPIIAELEKIMATGEGGRGQGQIQFQPMERMNAVLVIARSKAGLDAAARWVQRLDRADPASVGVKVYRLRYAPAKSVAAMLNESFGGQAVAAGQRDEDALQPGGGTRGGERSQGGFKGSTPQSEEQAATGGAGAAGIETRMAGFGTGAETGGAGGGGASGGGSGGGGGKIRVTPDTIHNSLLIFADAQSYRLIEATIRQIDRPPEQVAIEATIAEVALTDRLQYGVQAYLESHSLGLGRDKGAGGFTTSLASAAIGAAVPGANLILGPALNPRVVLNALHSLTNVKILSSPSLVVLDNQTATLQVGNQVAIKTQSSQSTESLSAPIINNITYKDTGIILRVQPRIGANGVVNLEIEQEISNVVDNSGGADGLTPTISQRRVKSTIAVPNGQTVMLAGLISETTSTGRRGLPGSIRWGLLGDLLSSHNNQAERNELVIFIRPQIISDQTDAQAVAEEFRARLTTLSSDYGVPAKALVTK